MAISIVFNLIRAAKTTSVPLIDNVSADPSTVFAHTPPVLFRPLDGVPQDLPFVMEPGRCTIHAATFP